MLGPSISRRYGALRCLRRLSLIDRTVIFDLKHAKRDRLLNLAARDATFETRLLVAINLSRLDEILSETLAQLAELSNLSLYHDSNINKAISVPFHIEINIVNSHKSIKFRANGAKFSFSFGSKSFADIIMQVSVAFAFIDFYNRALQFPLAFQMTRSFP